MNRFNTHFDAATLSMGISQMPIQYGRLQALFPFEGLPTRSVAIDFESNRLRLVPAHAWGGQPSTGTKFKRKTVILEIPQMTMEDVVYPMDVQDVRAFGSDNQLTTVNAETERKLMTERKKHEITLEYRKARALDGLILDADGSTVLYDLYSEFGVTQHIINFNLGSPTTDILLKCQQVRRLMEDNLLGDTMSNIRVFVSRDFMDAFIAHPNVQKFYLQKAGTENLTAQNIRANFAFGGLIFEEFYERSETANSATIVEFIDPGFGFATPEGTSSLYRSYGAPGDFNEAVNTIALPFYAKTERRKFDRGVDLHTQCNQLPLITQPNAIIKVQAF
jgi:hypothetical protein